MKKIFITLTFLTFIFALFGCKKKPAQLKDLEQATKYIEKNIKQDVKNFEIDKGCLKNIKDKKLISSILVIDGVECIKEDAVSNLENVKSIVITKDVKKVEKKSFTNLPNLINIFIIGNEKEIEHQSFYELEKLNKVYFDGITNLKLTHNPFYLNKELESFEVKNSQNLAYEQGALIYKNEVITLTKEFKGQFSSNARILKSWASGLNRFDKIKELDLKNVEVVQTNVFLNIDNLEVVKVSASLKELNADFATRHMIKKIEKTEENNTFDVKENTLIKGNVAVLLSKESNLTNLDIEEIGIAACSGNISIELENIKKILFKVKKIESLAFAGCISLKGELDLTSNTNLKEVKSHIFQNVSVDFFVRLEAHVTADTNWNAR